MALSSSMPLFLTKLAYNIGLKMIVMVTIVVELPALGMSVIKNPFPIITLSISILSIAISGLKVAKTCASTIHSDI